MIHHFWCIIRKYHINILTFIFYSYRIRYVIYYCRMCCMKKIVMGSGFLFRKEVEKRSSVDYS